MTLAELKSWLLTGFHEVEDLKKLEGMVEQPFEVEANIAIKVGGKTFEVELQKQGIHTTRLPTFRLEGAINSISKSELIASLQNHGYTNTELRVICDETTAIFRAIGLWMEAHNRTLPNAQLHTITRDLAYDTRSCNGTTEVLKANVALKDYYKEVCGRAYEELENDS